MSLSSLYNIGGTSSKAKFQRGQQSVLLTEKKMLTQLTPLEFLCALKYP